MTRDSVEDAAYAERACRGSRNRREQDPWRPRFVDGQLHRGRMREPDPGRLVTDVARQQSCGARHRDVLDGIRASLGDCERLLADQKHVAVIDGASSSLELVE